MTYTIASSVLIYGSAFSALIGTEAPYKGSRLTMRIHQVGGYSKCHFYLDHLLLKVKVWASILILYERQRSQ